MAGESKTKNNNIIFGSFFLKSYTQRVSNLNCGNENMQMNREKTYVVVMEGRNGNGEEEEGRKTDEMEEEEEEEGEESSRIFSCLCYCGPMADMMVRTTQKRNRGESGTKHIIGKSRDSDYFGVRKHVIVK